MKRVLLYILMLMFLPAVAQEAGREYVNPDTEEDYRQDIKISISHVTKCPEKCIVRLDNNFFYPEAPGACRRVWLIVASQELPEGKQVIRDIGLDEERRKDLLLITELMPKYEPVNGNGFQPSYFEMVIEESLITKSYLFIGYEGEVMDGGMRYSIDLGAYYKQLISANPKASAIRSAGK